MDSEAQESKCESCKYWFEGAEGHICTNIDSPYVAERVINDDWCSEYVGSRA